MKGPLAVVLLSLYCMGVIATSNLSDLVVPKGPITSSKLRFVFTAGLGGTGHHAWNQIWREIYPNGRQFGQGPLTALWYTEKQVNEGYDELFKNLKAMTN